MLAPLDGDEDGTAALHCIQKEPRQHATTTVYPNDNESSEVKEKKQKNGIQISQKIRCIMRHSSAPVLCNDKIIEK